MARYIVLLSSGIHEAGIDLIRKRNDVKLRILEDCSPQSLTGELTNADALIIRTEPLPPEAITQAQKLKVVSRHGVGYDNIPVAELNKKQIPLTLVGTANTVSVAEHIINQLLALARKGPVMDRSIREGNWKVCAEYQTYELAKRTLLLIGFGRIGKCVAQRAIAMGMTVLACDPYIEAKVFEKYNVLRVADWRKVLNRVDAVSLHVPGTIENKYMIDSQTLNAMKKGCWLINSARGNLIDERALAEALHTGIIGGAALDVLEEEPPTSSHHLMKLDNVILSPHSAALTEESMMRMGIECARNALDGIDGDLRVEVVANPQVLPKSHCKT